MAPLRGATFGVGRAASNDLVLRDQAVSACHAQLVRSSGGGDGGGEAWRVSDLGSSNGTCVRLSPERTPSRAFGLAPGHSLLLGLGPKCADVLLGRFRVGVAARQGRRPSMEDAHVALESLPPPPGWAGEWPLLSFYAVYDGHGGGEAAEFAKAHLHRHLLVHLGEQLSRRGAEATEATEATGAAGDSEAAGGYGGC